MKSTDIKFSTIKVRETNLPKLKRIAALEDRPLQDVIDQAFTDYIKRYEAAVGREVTDINVRQLVERLDAHNGREAGRKTGSSARKKPR